MTSRRRAGAISGLALSAALLGALLLGPRVRAAARLSPGFVAHAAEPRLFQEPGGDLRAEAIAEALPEIAAHVEEVLGRPFATGFRVYLPASHRSFCRRPGLPPGSPVRGMALARDVWLSPLAFEYRGRDTHRESLAHELVHLHVAQHLGWVHRVRTLPTWFSEGLADVVADTGFESFGAEAAATALLEGPRFSPDAAGRLPTPRPPNGYGLPAPLLHAEARLFVEHLRNRDERAFRELVGGVLDGRPFSNALDEAFRRSLDRLWSDFLGELRRSAEAADEEHRSDSAISRGPAKAPSQAREGGRS